MPLQLPPWVRVRNFPFSVGTSAQAAAALGIDLSGIAKSLIFITPSNNPLLIIVSGTNRVDKRKLGEYMGMKIKIAGSEYILEKTGYPVGAVPPFGHKQTIWTFMDKELFKHHTIWASAGTNHSLFSASPSQIAEIAHAEIVDIS